MTSRPRAQLIVPATILTTLLLWAPLLMPACGSNGGGNGATSGPEAGEDTSVPPSAQDGGADASEDASQDASPDWLVPPFIPRDAGEAVLAPLRAACAFEAGAWPAETIGNEYPLGSDIPIKHVIVIMQENRSFDHYLGRLVADGFYKPGDFTVVVDGGLDSGALDAATEDAGATAVDSGLGPPGSGFSHSDEVDVPPPGWSNPDADGGAVYPHPDDEYCYGVDHSWTGQHNSWDNGKNDGFVVQNDPDGQRAMFYEDQDVIPFYYALANTFSIADRAFCSVLGPTWPNRFYLMAATSFGIADNTPCGLDTAQHPVAQIFSLLDQGGHTWSDYTDGPHQIEFFSYYGFLTTTFPHLKTLDCGLMKDIADDTLPDVAVVMGDEITPEFSDEGPSDLPGIGGQVVEQIIRNLWASPAWKDTAVFITRDENGGIADHVPPAPACVPDGYGPYESPAANTTTPVPGAFNTTGFRIPFIVVSPYSRAHFVSHTVYDHTSITRFIEARFGLPALTARDANAIPPFEMFDFANPPFMVPPTIAAHTTVDPAVLKQCGQTLAPLSCPEGGR